MTRSYAGYSRTRLGRVELSLFSLSVFINIQYTSIFPFFTVTDDYMSMKCFHLFGARVIKIS